MNGQAIGKLHIGTSSWTFPDWRGVFYPDGIPAREHLNYYATKFNSVEVNTSFYGLPAPKTLLQWVESVPDGFTFSLKAPKEITHERRLTDAEPITLAYLDVLRSLGGAAAPGFLQFPPSFSRRQFGKRLADFIDWLVDQADGVTLAVEVRASDLMTGAFASFLAERGFNFVVVERTGQPDTFASWQAANTRNGNKLPLYVRLIGNDREPLPDDKEIRRPQDEILDKWAGRMAELLAAGLDVYCYVHNPFEGHSPATIRRLLERITGHLDLPVWSPEVIRPVEEENDGQLSLFE